MDEPLPPAHWAADVVLRDGRPCHVRPIEPDDADRLRRFHAQLSERTVYLRFFAPYPELTDADVARFTTVDHADRVALVATVGDDIIGVARYDRLGPDEAEVAFTIRDDHQGRGLGSVLLEHLAAAARERGVLRFVAEVLPENRRMQATFEEAGFTTRRQLADGYLSLEFAIEPTARMRAVMQARERASEARSIRRLLAPRSVAVVGASRTEGSAGHTLLRNLRDAGFAGSLIAVHPEAHSILGVPCVPSIAMAPAPVDLAVVAVRSDRVLDVVDECARAAVRGLVVVSTGFAETASAEGRDRERELVARARGNGMRVLGPAALGMLNTDPRVRLNASLAPLMPPRGRLGLFCHSGGLSAMLLAELVERGLALSTFVSAGNRADVSGNDLLQYWAEDDSTDAVLLYLETLGNPRKFTRVVRGLARRKPVIVVRSGRVARATLPPAAVDALFDECGVIQAASAREMLDIASLVALQPAPSGPGVAVISTSDRLDALAADVVTAAGLEPASAGGVLRLPLDPAVLEERLRSADRAPGVGALLVVHVPPLPGEEQTLRAGIRAALPHLTRPLLVVSVAEVGDPVPGGARARWVSLPGEVPEGPAAPAGSAPLFSSVEEAVRALAAVVGHARWAERESGEPFAHPDAVIERAEALCGELDSEPMSLAPDVVTDLLGILGIGPGVEPTDPHASVPCRVRVEVDPSFGPVLSVGLAGPIPELLGDRAYASPPLTEAEAAALVRAPRAAPLLAGALGTDPVDLGALEQVLLRVASMADSLACVHGVDLEVLAHPAGARVTSAAISVGAPASASQQERRSM